MKTAPLNLAAANDAPTDERCTTALRDLVVLLARAHVRDIAKRAPANVQWAPPAVPTGLSV